ncbi:hypothetical protein G7B40_042210, partial [Aetokthonos hydrillicola Thurmond2011]
MLFSSLDNQKINQINNTENLILDLEKQLELARLQLSQLQQEVQSQKSAKSAAETALEMVSRAKALISFAYGSEGLEEFNTALLNVSFDHNPDPDQLFLNAAIDLDDVSEEEPDSPAPQQETIIDIVSEPVTEATPEQTNVTLLGGLDYRQLQKLAGFINKNIQDFNSKGLGRDELEKSIRDICNITDDTNKAKVKNYIK